MSAVTAWYRPEAWEAYREALTGRYAAEFWGLEVLVGLVVPLILAAYAYRRISLLAGVVASMALLIAGFASKYNLIIYGQVARLEHLGLETLIGAAYAATGYHPTAPEALLFLGAVVAWPALLLLGTLVPPLARGEKPSRLYIFGEESLNPV